MVDIPGVDPKFYEGDMVMHWLVKQLVTLIGAYYAGALERAITSLPHDALDAA
jgi:hypothetical protein